MAISIRLPEQIQWKTSSSGAAEATLVGDPAKPGLYVVLTKWTAPAFFYLTAVPFLWLRGRLRVPDCR